MSAARLGRYIGNRLYQVAFPIYRPLYGAFKTYADRAERRLLARYLSAGSVAVDAGANIGIYSQFLSRCVGPNGKVHSFEPSPENFAHLRDALASLPNVRLNQMAVSDRSGESVLYVSDDLNVDHRAYPTEGETRKTVSIQSTTLDDYFQPGDRVDLIKMDIQGYELHALQGAERVLQDNPEVKLFLEFWPYGLSHAGASAEALLRFLKNHGFVPYLWEASRLKREDHPPANPRDPMSYTNLFVQKEEAIA